MTKMVSNLRRRRWYQTSDLGLQRRSLPQARRKKYHWLPSQTRVALEAKEERRQRVGRQSCSSTTRLHFEQLAGGQAQALRGPPSDPS